MRTTKINKMETTPVSKLLLFVSTPIMFSMMVQALYNVVDSIYISRFSEKALSAVSLTVPVQTLMIAIGIGTCIGINTFLSRTLGQKNHEKVKAIVQHGALLILLSYLITLFIGLFFSHSFFSLQTTDPKIIAYGSDYMFICMVFSFSLFGQQLFEKLLQANGKSMLSMISQIIGAIINIVLDPLFIFGLGSFPALGAKGAALATVIGQTIAFICAFVFHQHYNKDLKLSLTQFKFNITIVKEIYKIGLPAMVMQAIGSVTNFLVNGILLSFSTTVMAVYGICARLQNFVFMPIYGLTNGMLPIMSYNFGARQRKRVLKTRFYAFVYMLIIIFAGILSIQIFPNQLLDLFGASEEMKKIGIPALRIISVSFIFEGFCLINQTSFQTVGRNLSSLICSITRQIILLIPLVYIFSLSGNINYVWIAFPTAYSLSAIICHILWKDVFQKNIAPLTKVEPYASSEKLTQNIIQYKQNEKGV
ncbi:putative MATE family efflux protein [Breznakia sp. PF5-3]|uniref:MATE family efflux transporter n=1 Tax=unclassified Breznakia TaxID=2623764 RepID=UPI002404EC6E|nr:MULTISPECIES: MATE family efflux transporter [unclassified Breznakia]MDF9823979.1 putative MATE family efflux protein [Breznakia sp. PM6-1]MDF9834778.1 putative MATE family efflux protein [Breznakia sp. PF5-3]MDF9838045.1 putative MATE family efflux protein [Breznakia sp. PFB2-8]MDF9860031.1 putative MATE family efflux protein [Breznakia sp. PH5-24]